MGIPAPAASLGGLQSGGKLLFFRCPDPPKSLGLPGAMRIEAKNDGAHSLGVSYPGLEDVSGSRPAHSYILYFSTASEAVVCQPSVTKSSTYCPLPPQKAYHNLPVESNKKIT